MMMGLPCISTKSTGTKEVIRTGQNGLLVERGDKDGLLPAMNKMIDDPVLERSCRKKAIKTAGNIQFENSSGSGSICAQMK